MCTQIPHLLVFCELQSSSRSLVTRSFITELCTIESELSTFDCPLCKYKHSSQPLASLTQWNTVNLTFSVMDNNHRSQENPVLARSVIKTFRSIDPGMCRSLPTVQPFSHVLRTCQYYEMHAQSKSIETRLNLLM